MCINTLYLAVFLGKKYYCVVRYQVREIKDIDFVTDFHTTGYWTLQKIHLKQILELNIRSCKAIR